MSQVLATWGKYTPAEIRTLSDNGDVLIDSDHKPKSKL